MPRISKAEFHFGRDKDGELILRMIHATGEVLHFDAAAIAAMLTGPQLIAFKAALAKMHTDAENILKVKLSALRTSLDTDP
jgi:hypothetical protein